MASDQQYLIALGANLPVGEELPQVVLPKALDELAACGVRVIARSRLFRTPCFPPGAGPDYVNAAAVLECDLQPDALLDILHRIEARFGRARQQRWGMRTLDLDLIARGQTVLPDPATQRRWMKLARDRQATETPDQLILPHPRLQDRAFVLVPLAEVAPDWCHPVSGLTVAEMCAGLPAKDRDAVIPIT
jgi:2-amino-4-hydroxy-6-hydroxymethyldihydropteridine diphosphokinase